MPIKLSPRRAIAKKPVIKKATGSKPSELFALQLRMSSVPKPDQELRFHNVRRWRFDFAWPDYKIAAEIDGATYTQGRHTRGAGYEKDCEKLNTAILCGWQVFRFTSGQVQSGYAIETIKKYFQEME